ncbi:MAG: hypothetical protein AAGA65_09150 [Actinomycetota bacterium]
MDGNVERHALPTFRELTFVQEDMGRGVWTLETSFGENSHVLGEWLDGPHPGISVWSPDNDHRAVGYLVDYTITETAAGLDLRAAGMDWLGLLDDALVWPTPNIGELDLAEFWRYQTEAASDTVERVARLWVSQVIAAASYDFSGDPLMLLREYPWPTDLGPALPAGTAVDVVGEALRTLQRVRELLEGTGSHLRMELDVQSQIGRLIPTFTVADRPKSRTPLAVSERTLGKVENTFRAATATRVIGVGAEIGGGPAREVVDASNLATNDWRHRYIEGFISEPNLSGAELLRACQEAVAAGGPTQSVVATDPQAGIWGTDLDVGWLADVAVVDHRGQREFVELPVVASTLVADAEGQTRSIEFGARERRNLDGVFARIGELQDELERTKRKV